MRKKYGVHLSKELRKTYGTRSISVRKGDRVTVTKGKFKKKSGKIESIDKKKGRLLIDKIKVKKPDGSERFFPIAIPNVVAIELELSDQRRKIIFDRKADAKTKRGDKKPKEVAKKTTEVKASK